MARDRRRSKKNPAVLMNPPSTPSPALGLYEAEIRTGRDMRQTSSRRVIDAASAICARHHPKTQPLEAHPRPASFALRKRLGVLVSKRAVAFGWRILKSRPCGIFDGFGGDARSESARAARSASVGPSRRALLRAIFGFILARTSRSIGMTHRFFQQARLSPRAIISSQTL